jgi:hypothetical protein
MNALFVKYPFPSWVFAVWDDVSARLSKVTSTIIVRAFLRLHRCDIGTNLQCDGIPLIRMQRPGAIKMGDNVSINTRRNSNMAGMMQRTTLHCIGDGRIVLHDRAGISGTILSSRQCITVGQGTLLGVNTRVYDHDFHSIVPEHRTDRKLDSSMVRSKPVEIGEDVLIGANAIILKGVRIGDRCVVGAGSVVTRGDYPSGSTIAGNPAGILSKP